MGQVSTPQSIFTPTATKGIYIGIGGDPTANRYGPAGNSINPTATLEVNSWNPSSTPGGSSGLRFTNLNTTSPSIGNPGNGVLSVDANGDVIYITGSSGSSLGNYCNAPQNNLTSSYQIPMNNQNFYFTNNDVLGQNHVGIGIPCNTNLSAKLTVYQNHPTTVNTRTTGIIGHNDDVANIPGLDYNGVFGSADGV